MPGFLTFNVFVGSPFPCVRGGTTSLEGSSRLARQLEAVAALEADVVALQEVYGGGILDAYTRHFSDTHDALAVRQPATVLGRLSAFLLPLTVGILVGACFLLVATADDDDDVAVVVTAVGAATVVGWAVAWLLLRHSALLVFLAGDVAGALVVLVRRGAFEVVTDAAFYPFADQNGDPMNHFRPRGFLVVNLRDRTTGDHVCVVNVHTNALGADAHRAHQTEAAFAVATTAKNTLAVVLGDMNANFDAASVRCHATYQLADAYSAHGDDGGGGATWVGTNRLSHGHMRVPDQHCDYILYAPAAGVDAEQSSCCVVFADDPTSDHLGVLATLAPRKPCTIHSKPSASHVVAFSQ